MGLLVLTLTISALALHSWFFVEIHFNVVAFNGIAFVKLDRIVNRTKNTFFNKSNYFHLHYFFFFSSNICECL